MAGILPGRRRGKRSKPRELGWADGAVLPEERSLAPRARVESGDDHPGVGEDARPRPAGLEFETRARGERVPSGELARLRRPRAGAARNGKTTEVVVARDDEEPSA